MHVIERTTPEESVHGFVGIIGSNENTQRFKPGDLIRAYVIFGEGPFHGEILAADNGGFEIEITEPDHRLTGEAMPVIERQLIKRVGSDLPTE